MEVDISKFESRESIKNTSITLAVKADDALFTLNDRYPRGFMVLTGGTLTVWTSPSSGTTAVKQDFGTVPSGFTWTFGGVCGIAETNESDEATTADNIVWIP